jgi:hypothetical protein
MAAPTVAHKGFFVPNAQDVTKPELAEPDRIDFNIAGNARWGVITGCVVSVTGATASCTAGTALVNGKLVDVVAGQNASMGTGGTQDRFDIIGVDKDGVLVTVRGTPSLDPVFPDPPIDVTVLAAVLCSGSGSYSDNVIDKRNMLADSLKTKLSPDADLLMNRNGSGNLFHIDGAGKTSWQGDVSIERSAAGTLRVTSKLTIDDTLAVGGTTSMAKSLTVVEKIYSSNLRNASALPADAAGNPGDIFQHSVNGKGYLHQNGKWEEIATLKSSVPTGTVITSLQPPSYMTSLGWILLDGGVITETEAGALFTIPALAVFINTPPSGPRTMTLPDARRRVMLFNPDNVAHVGGQFNFLIGVPNLPPHKHNPIVQKGGGFSPQITIGRSGTHRHTVTGGAHGHPINDPGHAHNGADHILGGGFICAAYGGQNKIDALFNDRSHTYSVEMALWTRRALTGISIGSAGSEHTHAVDAQGDHDHQVTMIPVPAHDHVGSDSSVGEGTAVPFTPAYLSVYAYIRS